MSQHVINELGYGIIVGFRRALHRQYNDQVLVKVLRSKYLRVDGLLGSKVLVRDDRNEYRGKVVKVHSGKNNVVVVSMKKGIPGQLLGSEVVILQ
jgi:ribosomal protein L35AE/L33A